MPELSKRVSQFTDSVIRRMTRISDEHGAINLSQGFPDFDPPREILDALAKAAYAGRTNIPLPSARPTSAVRLWTSSPAPLGMTSTRIRKSL